MRDDALNAAWSSGSTLQAIVEARQNDTLLCLAVTYTSDHPAKLRLEPSGSFVSLPVSIALNFIRGNMYPALYLFYRAI
jgi:hypothetical protein